MPNLPQRFPFTLAAGGALSARLDVRCWSVIVSNFTAQYLEILDANDFVPPNTRQILSLPGVLVGQANFAAPSGITQPTAVAGQRAYLTYTEQVLPPSGGVVGATAIASQVTLERFAKAAFPAAGNIGRLILATDDDRGVWKDTGTVFASVEGHVFDITQFGAIGDSGVTDNGVAIRACITAAMAAGQGARIRVPGAVGFYGFTGGLSVNGAVGLSIIGAGGISNGGPVPSTLRATDAPTRVLDARNTEGLVIEDCSIVCANAGFTGTVVDFTSANHFTLSRCQVLHTAQGTFVDVSNTILWQIIDCSFNGSAITGASIGIKLGGASVTTARIRDCNFKCSGNFTPISGSTTIEASGIVMSGITLDGVGNATPAVALIDFSTSTLNRGITINGLWSGDMGAASTGRIIHAGLVRGLSIVGSFIAGSGNAGAQTGITITAVSDGVLIAGNDIFSLLVGIAITGYITAQDVTHNRNTAATAITGYAPGEAVVPPAVPASGVNATNFTGRWVTVHITAGAGAITAVTVNGTVTGLVAAAGASVTTKVGPGVTISVTYPGAAPTWTWFGD